MCIKYYKKSGRCGLCYNRTIRFPCYIKVMKKISLFASIEQHVAQGLQGFLLVAFPNQERDIVVAASE